MRQKIEVLIFHLPLTSYPLISSNLQYLNARFVISLQIRTGRGETLRWAVCVPNACDASAVAGFVGDVLSHTVGNSTGVEVTEKDCYTRTPLTVSKLDIAFM